MHYSSSTLHAKGHFKAIYSYLKSTLKSYGFCRPERSFRGNSICLVWQSLIQCQASQMYSWTPGVTPLGVIPELIVKNLPRYHWTQLKSNKRSKALFFIVPFYWGTGIYNAVDYLCIHHFSTMPITEYLLLLTNVPSPHHCSTQFYNSVL